MNPVVVTRQVSCKADVSTVWKLITDTDRLNRLAGLPPIESEALNDAGAARFLVTTEAFGGALVYEEHPFEWVENERFSILRRVREGALESLGMVFLLEPREPSGTTVTLTLTLLPRAGVEGVNEEVAEHVLADLVQAVGKVQPISVHASTSCPGLPELHVNVEAFKQAGDELRRRTTDDQDYVVKRLIQLVGHGSDSDVARIRPFAEAATWSADPREVLSVFLEAVLSGLLEMRWDLVCPSCRTQSATVANLSELDADGHCQQCDIQFGLDLDRAVEATFAPPPHVRTFGTQTYCAGGPARTPHVLAQVVLPAGEERELPAPESSGRYRLFIRGGATAAVVVDAERGTEEVRLRADGEALEPAEVVVTPKGRVVIEWAGESDTHAKLEHVEWSSQAATAHDLSLLPSFRRQFGSQVLRPGLSLKVSRVAILFTDLTASTEMYTRLGDAAAFEVVQDHFELLFGIVQEHGGVIVKTIGDAIMAAFSDESQAVTASVAMLLAFPGFAKEREDVFDLSVKLGVFAAACYAVNANDQLDYFGQCVNIAARLQGQAKGGECVLTRDLAELAETSGWLKGCHVAERFSAALKGVEAPIEATRIRVTKLGSV